MRRYTRFLSVAAATLFTALIASCGGGGGDGYTAPPPTMLNATTLKNNGYYFNVHTSLCSAGGEIRGQIVPLGTTGQETITTTLTSAQEVPTCGPGTGSGTGTLIVNLDTGVVISASIGGITGLSGPATAAHIHSGSAGVPGPVVITLNIGGGTIGY